MTSLNLQVMEGSVQDVGRAVVRLDPEDARRLSVDIGDVVWVRGAKNTLARVLPAHRDHRGKQLIQMDGVLRRNAGTALGDEVEVERADATPAQQLELMPLGRRPSDADLQTMGQLVDGIPLVKGDRLRITLFGSRFVEFEVLSCRPPGPCVISPQTKLFITEDERASTPATPLRHSYEDIGGLSGQIHRIRETIELPLRHPEVFARLGIDAPRGVLLHGPPGCGKTLTARVIAEEASAAFFSVSGPEIIHKFYGESEAHLRKVFDEASKKSPAIIFLDEVDAIAPKREDAGGDVEKRVVATLLTLMDGLEDRGNVIVIAATNRPNAIDPALRRPGRFDREIAIPIPDRLGRHQILSIHSRGMPLDESVDLEFLAERTHGYVGADLQALCREAAMAALRRAIPNVDAFASVNLAHLQTLHVEMDDFRSALREIRPTATREVFVDVPDVEWSDVGGLADVKSKLIEAVEWPLEHPELFARADVRPPRGILLCGPPGCGKTLLAKAVASQTQANFISVKGPSLLDKFVGESERRVRDVFAKAREAAPCIVFFDEIDAIASRRDSAGSDSVGPRVLAQLLTEIDGVEDLGNVLVLAATNRRDILDPAVLRPGRFDEIVEIPPPEHADRAEILRVHLRTRPTEANVDVAELASATAGFSGAEIAEMCRRATYAALRRAVESELDASELLLTNDDLNQAVVSVSRTPRKVD